MSKKIKIGDNVIVRTGKDKGKTGEIFEIDRKNLKVKVRGINIVKKHRKPSQDQPGGIEQIETYLNISNVGIIDPKDKKVTRVRYKFEKNKQIRIASRSGEEIKS